MCVKHLFGHIRNSEPGVIIRKAAINWPPFLLSKIAALLTLVLLELLEELPLFWSKDAL